MGDGSKEREVARRLGFGRPKSPIPFEPHEASAGASVIERLGLRSGSRVAMIGVTDPAVLGLRHGTSLQVSAMVPHEPVDVIIFQVESAFALRRMSELAKLVAPRGVFWVLWPSNGRHLTRNHVERACIAAGMTCTLTVGVTGRLSGMKYIHRFADAR